MAKEERKQQINLGWPVLYHPHGDMNSPPSSGLVVKLGRECLGVQVRVAGGLYFKDGVLFHKDPRVPLAPQEVDQNGLWSFIPEFQYPPSHTGTPYPPKPEKNRNQIGPLPVAKDMQTAAQMKADGKSIADIATAMQCSHSQVQRMLETAEASPAPKPSRAEAPAIV